MSRSSEFAGLAKRSIEFIDKKKMMMEDAKKQADEEDKTICSQFKARPFLMNASSESWKDVESKKVLHFLTST